MCTRKLNKLIIVDGTSIQMKIAEDLDIKNERYKCEKQTVPVKYEKMTNEMKLQELAHQKGSAAARHFSMAYNDDLIIVAIETATIMGNRMFKKPRTEKQIATLLKNLSGKTHKVVSGVCLWWGKKGVTIKDETLVTFREISDEEIAKYAESKDFAYPEECFNSGKGMEFVEKIEGSFYNLLGMPMNKIYELLEAEFLFKIVKETDCGIWEISDKQEGF